MPRRQADPQLPLTTLPASLVANIRPPQPLNIHGDRVEEWQLFEQQFDWYAAATSLAAQPENIQIAVFMSTLGSEAVKEYNSLKLSPAESQKLDSIKSALRSRFAPTRNFRFERYLFNKITQSSEEKFDSFLTRVMSRAKKCNFGDLLDDLIVDRIIFGIKDDQLRTKLLDIDPLSLFKTTTLCRSAESCKEQSQVVTADSQLQSTTTSSVAAIKTPTQQNQSSQQPRSYPCRNCGTSHAYRQCPAFGKSCSSCGKVNHFAAQCRARNSPNINPSRKPMNPTTSTTNPKPTSSLTKKVAELNVDDEDHTSNADLYVNAVYADSTNLSDTLYVNSVSVFSVDATVETDEDWFEVLVVADEKVRVKLDSGAQCNVLPLKSVQKMALVIQPSRIRRIASYSDTSFKMPVLGEVLVPAQFESRPNREFHLTFLVVSENVAPILGRKSCVACGFIKRIHSVQTQSWDDIRQLFQTLFTGLGFVPAFPYDAVLVDNPQLTIYPARRIPFNLLAPVKTELDLMETLKVIRPITEPTPAVSPMVLIRKNGKIRIGLDPSNINKNLKRHHYPLKTVEEIAAKVSGSKFFTVLDCYKGYWQIPLTEKTQKLLTFSTPWGRYSCLRLPYGISSAPEIFQRIMNSILQDLNNVEISMDDVLIHAPSELELKNYTCAVLTRLRDAGFKLNPQKCVFGATQVKFLGHLFSASGLLPDPSKVEGIAALKTPSNIPELQRFLGSVTYLGKFIENLSQLTEPLRKLLKKDVIWHWTFDQENAFQKLKQVLASTPVLRFYDVNKSVTLSVDASSKALGAVLLQDQQPVAYATRALTDSQTFLPQIEKEALAVRFACEKFHDYIYGKPLTIESDHKPLESIFKKPIFKAPPRLKRILLDVAIYNPTVIYKKGKDIPLPDLLSRDCDSIPPDQLTETEVLLILPISDAASQEFKDAIRQDADLQTLSTLIRSGWPQKVSSVPLSARPYFNFRDELAIHEGLLIKGEQLIVPLQLRPKMLKLIHQGHLGIESSTKRAREALFWPGMSKEIATFITNCSICQSTARNKQSEPLILKDIPARPWQIVASDIFQLANKHYLLIVDSYSGFTDFQELKTLSSPAVIEKFKAWFAVHGIPDYLDTDGGPQFASSDFKLFAKAWNFTHRLSSPHYPQSNGLAERNVATVKNLLRKCQLDKSDPYLALLNWRNTPRSPSLPSPNERLMSRKTKTLLPISPELLLPKPTPPISAALESARNKQKSYADVTASPQPDFTEGDAVWLRVAPRTWIPAKITQKLPAPRSYEVLTNKGQVLRRNTSFLRRSYVPFTPTNTQQFDEPLPEPQPQPPSRPRRIIKPPQRLDL